MKREFLYLLLFSKKASRASATSSSSVMKSSPNVPAKHFTSDSSFHFFISRILEEKYVYLFITNILVFFNLLLISADTVTLFYSIIITCTLQN